MITPPRGRGITETNGMGEGLLSLDSHFMNAPTSGVNLAWAWIEHFQAFGEIS
jgi:hypothetical protein